MRVLRFLAGWLAAFYMLLVRWTCSIRWHDDPRPQLRQQERPYSYAVLHSHQIAAVVAGEPGTGAMVSRSADGDLLVPSLRVRGIVPVRGSSSSTGKSKGGAAALERLIEHVRGGAPAYLAVDGPRGPRNRVQLGIASLAKRSGSAVLLVAPIPNRRWILTRTWDRMQVPKPFTRIDGYFDAPLWCEQGESLEDFRQRVEDRLTALEAEHDPFEAEAGRRVAEARRAKSQRESAQRA